MADSCRVGRWLLFSVLGCDVLYFIKERVIPTSMGDGTRDSWRLGTQNNVAIKVSQVAQIHAMRWRVEVISNIRYHCVTVYRYQLSGSVKTYHKYTRM